MRRLGRAAAPAVVLAAALAAAAPALAQAPAPAVPAAPGRTQDAPAPDDPAEAGSPPGPSPAAAPDCPPRQARFRLSVSDPDPVLSRDLDVDALHAETGRPRSATAHHLGLTTSRVEWRSRVDVRYLRARPAGAPGGPERVCVVPSEVSLTLAQAEHRIRIAREIPPESCLFREVEAHERRHVEVNRRTLREAAARARAAGQAWTRTAEARGATLEEAMATLRQDLRRAIEPSLAAMRAARERGHGAIDTPAEYRRLGRVCPEDQAALRERLRAKATRAD